MKGGDGFYPVGMKPPLFVRALTAAERLRSVGILAQAIRPPTVPIGSARLRLTVKATFSPTEIARLAHEVIAACE